MSNFNWNYPTNIWGGENRIKDLNKACIQLNMKNPLIVTDSGLAKSKMLLETIIRLNAEGIKSDIFSNIVGNPTGNNVNEGVNVYQQNKNDGVIAFGGGSALDVGKAIAFMSGQNLSIWEFEDKGDNWKKANNDKIASIIAIPTTAGTGSEAGRASVLLNEDIGVKKIIFHLQL